MRIEGTSDRLETAEWEKVVCGTRCQEKREFKDNNSVNYYRENKENEKQGKAIGQLKSRWWEQTWMVSLEYWEWR